MTDKKKSDIYRLRWDEYFEKELKVLAEKVLDYIKEKGIKIDAVVPLLRGGNIPGTYLAYRLNILRITPVQYKYFFKDEVANLVQIQKVNEELFDKNTKLTFLLVEGNHCYGTSAKYAAKGLKKQFPNCKIVYAASNMDYNYLDAADEFVDVSLYGRLNNDCEEMDRAKCEELGIDFDKVVIFPWENEDEEWTTFAEMKQFPFGDMEETEKKAEIMEEFRLDEL
ncbi:MAG: phosphoribosyltransferase [archaeon]